jgi:phage tail sheath protein FI
MSTRRTPGVYVEEVSSGSKPIEGVGTAVAAFVGLAPGGPVGRPIRISSWNQFGRVYSDPQPENGPFMPGAYLAHAVYGFFQNGGGTCWVVGLGRRGDAASDPERAAALREGLGSLAAVQEITIVCLPDLVTLSEETESASPAGLGAVLVEDCERAGNRMAILDPPAELGAQEVLDWRTKVGRYDSASATLYYPWIEVTEPGSDEPILVPPSGHVAGVWARTDNSFGIHRAPTDVPLLGVSGLASEIKDSEDESLDRAGVNSIRSFPRRGIRVWGARTLSSDPEWRYVNVRRLFMYVEESIDKGTQWAMFEPNDERLRSRLHSEVSRFLTRMWYEEALPGSSPEEAFYVKCDAETNPPDVIEAGQVVIEVGIAPSRPAEFVVIRIGRSTAEASELTEVRS